MMVTVTHDQAAMDALVARLDAAHELAARDTVQDIRARQAVRTGELRDSFQARPEPWPASRRALRRVFICSTAVYADAVEHGANAREKASVKKGTKARGIYDVLDGRRRRVGFEAGPLLNRRTRRGPHMAGNHVVAETAPEWLEHMGYRLRGGNYSGRGLR
jgi:hypothetical protein